MMLVVFPLKPYKWKYEYSDNVLRQKVSYFCWKIWESMKLWDYPITIDSVNMPRYLKCICWKQCNWRRTLFWEASRVLETTHICTGTIWFRWCFCLQPDFINSMFFRLLQQTFDSDFVRRQDVPVVFSALSKSNGGGKIAFNFLLENWSMIYDRFGFSKQTLVYFWRLRHDMFNPEEPIQP